MEWVAGWEGRGLAPRGATVGQEEPSTEEEGRGEPAGWRREVVCGPREGKKERERV